MLPRMITLLLDIHPHFSGDTMAVRFLDILGRSYLIHHDTEYYTILPAGWHDHKVMRAPSLEGLVKAVSSAGYQVINNTRFQQLPLSDN